VYVAYTSDISCDSNPPSNPIRGTVKITVQ
jgi:hypothetical protein